MSPEQAEHYVDAVAAAITLPIPADCRPGVVANLQRIAVLADKVNGFDLATDIEPAPVFSHAKR